MSLLLHPTNIIEDDFKLVNMLVDGYDNMWLTDLGDRTTKGWGNMETRKAIAKIAKFKGFLALEQQQYTGMIMLYLFGLYWYSIRCVAV